MMVDRRMKEHEKKPSMQTNPLPNFEAMVNAVNIHIESDEQHIDVTNNFCYDPGWGGNMVFDNMDIIYLVDQYIATMRREGLDHYQVPPHLIF